MRRLLPLAKQPRRAPRGACPAAGPCWSWWWLVVLLLPPQVVPTSPVKNPAKIFRRAVIGKVAEDDDCQREVLAPLEPENPVLGIVAAAELPNDGLADLMTWEAAERKRTLREGV